jgi:hypothetical protein
MKMNNEGKLEWVVGSNGGGGDEYNSIMPMRVKIMMAG